MGDPETPWTLEGSVEAEIRVEGSRFIGFACPIRQREEVEQVLHRIRKTYHDATHHAYAYRLTARGEVRFSDDGEPPGTAGRPILDTLDGLHLKDVLCVVTRYFGGVKLGKGGLARAYRRCAAETLAAARLVPRLERLTLRIRFPYALTGLVMGRLGRFKGHLASIDHGEEVFIRYRVSRSEAGALIQTLEEASGGRVAVEQEADRG